MLVGYVTEQQLIYNSFDSLNFRWQLTFFTNIPRVLTGKPILLDNDQYSAKYNNIVSQIDSTQTNEIIKKN